MLVHRFVHVVVDGGRYTILQMSRSEMGSRSRGQRAASEIVLVGEVMSGLCVVGMMVRLLCVMGVVGLRLELRDLHAKPLVGLTAIHHDMLTLVSLAIHVERTKSSSWIQGRGTGGGGGVGVEFQSPRRRVGPVSNDVSLVRVLLRLSLEVELPGPRLLEPVGTICHLTWQTRPCVVSLVENRLVGGRR